MKSSLGKAVKVIAVILGILGVIAAFGTATMNGVRFDFALFIITIAVSLILAVLLYGFGDMMENTRQIKQVIFELNSNMSELEARIKAKLDERPAPVKKAEAEKDVSAEQKASVLPAADPLSPYEALKSAAEIYEFFCASHKDASDEDIAACADRLKNIALREQGGYGNCRNNALSLLKSFYKHGCRIFAVDRSGSTFRCPACGNKIFSDRRSCHNCGALFRI